MSVGTLVLVFTSIAETVPILSGVGEVADENGPKLVTKAVLPSGVTAIVNGPELTGMSVGYLVLAFRSIADTVLLPLLTTKTVLPSGVIAPPTGFVPTGMSSVSRLVATSIVDTVPLPELVTAAVLPSGGAATPTGPEPTEMSVGSLVLVFTSIDETVPLP